MAVCFIVAVLLALSVALGMRGGEEADSDTEEHATLIRHDSLAPSYTYDGKIIRWYVFIDPDTGREYLYNDLGACTPRLGPETYDE